MNFLPETRFFPDLPSPGRARRIYPLFLPFSGCPRRCLFCAQDIQTGQPEAGVGQALERAARRLAERLARGMPALELAFFGGTFTALAEEDLHACLDFARHWRGRGALTGARCSTRPDALNAALLGSLRDAGVTLVELGVQSFQDQALKLSGRGYTGLQAREAVAMIRAAGLAPGIQLMPGMPGLDRRGADLDLALSAELAPECVRLYPCLVLEGTGLAALWRSGQYSPWSLDESVDFLAEACLRLESRGIAVIRMGLAEEPGLSLHVLAGPRHPELGNMARSLALYLYISRSLGKAPASGALEPQGLLYAPRRHQGAFWGSRKSMAPRYAALGLGPAQVRWWDEARFAYLPGPSPSRRARA